MIISIESLYHSHRAITMIFKAQGQWYLFIAHGHQSWYYRPIKISFVQKYLIFIKKIISFKEALRPSAQDINFIKLYHIHIKYRLGTIKLSMKLYYGVELAIILYCLFHKIRALAGLNLKCYCPYLHLGPKIWFLTSQKFLFY